MTIFLGAACAPAPATGEATSSVPDLTACEDPRPQVCALNYDPVCGYHGDDNYKTGGKTYGNACSACADDAVSGHRPGACE